ncbi:ATPase [bacterium (Candidatus Blackallbacteria) CG18_big_fil_WC_8_21_14_2_50_49_26]|nr:MAG: ATPase [bacterium (Candidatus Blackallbacteria) CG18_big_fil_WC_8_21_14_2_50_49_26]
MIFTILRRLKHSELGMFHAYRKLGKEGSKQRAINFDGDVVDRVFPSAKDTDKILIDCMFQEDSSTVTTIQQWLKRQDKNWRFEGNCPKSDYYNFVDPDCLFAMMVDAGVTPATASWVVIPETHVSYRSILDHAESGGLASAGMIALYGDECTHICQVLGDHYPTLFKHVPQVTPPTVSTGMAPHPLGTFMILANAGHDLPSAVADLVDNSISAGATEIDITFPNPNIGGRWMCVRDNGSGMTYEALCNAMRIGNPRAYESRDLGRYGFGLKGASWSQADTMTVVSRANGQVSHLTWDKAHLESSGLWETLSEEIPEKYIPAVEIVGDSGTSVLLTNMRPPAVMSTVRDVDPYNVEISALRAHLGLVFHRFLTGDARGRSTVSITINGIKVLGNNPVAHPLTRPHNQRQIQVQISEGILTNISLQAFVLPTEEQIKQYHSTESELTARNVLERLSLGGRMNASQGLYFYRLDRLIKWGGWCGVYAEDEHTKLLRVNVDFDRSADDLMKINISKREVQLSVTLKEAIKEAVKDGRSDARSRYDGKPPKSKQTKSRSTVAVPKLTSGAENSSLETTSNSKTGGLRQSSPTQEDQVNIRIVSMEAKWQQKIGFQKEIILEISEAITPLVSLVKTIENNAVAKRALAEFLRYLDGKLND